MTEPGTGQFGDSDRFGISGCHQYRQYGGRVANASCNCQQGLGDVGMLLSKFLKTGTDTMEPVHFVQKRFKGHWPPLFWKKPKVWEDFRWTGLGQKT